MTRPLHMPCAEWAEMLAAHAEALPPSDLAALEAHLSTCPACSLARTDYRMMHRLISALPAPEFPSGLSPRLLSLWAEEDRHELNEKKQLHGLATNGETRLQTGSEEMNQAENQKRSSEAALPDVSSVTQEEEAGVDETLYCRECGKAFLFTAGEQAFYRQRGVLARPGRCPACRLARRKNAAPLDDPNRLQQERLYKENITHDQ